MNTQEKKQHILTLLQNTYCRLRASKIQGVGVFAIRDIPKGINPFEGAQLVDSCLFEKQELAALPAEVQEMVNDFFVTDENGQIDIPEYGLNGIDVSFFINHSKTPNLITHDESETFETAHEIKKGEELTADYSTYDATPHN